MNKDSEQITFDTSVIVAKDQPLSAKGRCLASVCFPIGSER